MTLPRGVSFILKYSPFGRHGCQIIMYSGLATFVADMLGLSLVALSRCLDMIMVKKWTVFCSKKKNIFILFLLVWILGLVSIIVMLIVKSRGVEIGWNCETGGCGFICNCDVLGKTDLQLSGEDNTVYCNGEIQIWKLVHIFTFGEPILALIIIVCSY